MTTDQLGAGRLRIDLVSEHASPLAAIGGVDAGGQNVHVAALARYGLARFLADWDDRLAAAVDRLPVGTRP